MVEKAMKNRILYPILIALLSTQAFGLDLTQEQAQTEPQMRIGALPFPFFIYSRADDDLGQHSYLESKKEEDRGLVYTCRGGFIDIAHLRTGSDYTAFYVSKIKEAIKNGSKEMALKAQGPSSIIAKLPHLNLNEDEIIETAQYMAHNILTWHEFTTWYGWSALKIKNAEKMSGFSYEDIYSHLIGIEAAGRALKNKKLSYDQAMTVELDKMLNQENGELERVSRKLTKKITKSVKGEFYKRRSIFTYFLYKQTNIGKKSDTLSPLLVTNDSVSGCQSTQERKAHFFGENKGLVSIEIKPKIKQSKKILKDAGSTDGKIVIERDYETLIEAVERDILNYYDRNALLQY